MQWRYREEIVAGAGKDDVKSLDIPKDAICINLFQEQTSDVDFYRIACWLEPVKDESLKYPTLEESLQEIQDHTYTCQNCGNNFVDTEDTVLFPALCPSCENKLYGRCA